MYQMLRSPGERIREPIQQVSILETLEGFSVAAGIGVHESNLIETTLMANRGSLLNSAHRVYRALASLDGLKA